MTRCRQCEREILEPATTCGVCGNVPTVRQDPAPLPTVARAPEAASVAPVAPAVAPIAPAALVVPPSSPVVASARPAVAMAPVVPVAAATPVAAPAPAPDPATSTTAPAPLAAVTSDTGNLSPSSRRSSAGSTACHESTHAPRCAARRGGRLADVRHAEVLDAGRPGDGSRGVEEAGRSEASGT